jgi:hypothetical protein
MKTVTANGSTINERIYTVNLDGNIFQFDSSKDAELFACNNEIDFFSDEEGLKIDVNL